MNKQQTRSIFLTDSELKRMTGYKDRTKQMEWLSDNGFTVRLGGGGAPLVTCQHVERLLA